MEGPFLQSMCNYRRLLENEAYRKWVCSSLVPYFAHGGPQDLESSEGTWTRIRPCLSLCQSVEQRCPYLLPGDRAPAYPTQYAGEPTFLCRDPNILETGEQATRALHSSDERECCFHVCSEQELDLGICANCTDRELRKRGREFDPPTAPHCEITPIQSESADEEEAAGWPVFMDDKDIEFGSTSTFFPMILHDQQQQQRQQQQYQGTSLCGSGGHDPILPVVVPVVGEFLEDDRRARAKRPTFGRWVCVLRRWK
ncbi:hypothetical protein HZH66_004950 [Vespula vulgaris]|uniref:Uncharacterized protein n=1 Tax=Vespula vulgaris TaxID=7454 RepID=A0A834K9J0_VESVU|nr:hypothetical protein HZH66_004950 [Vespula vulgaris]